jgi:hypothetical protein
MTMVLTKPTSQLFAMLNRAGVGAKLQARYVPSSELRLAHRNNRFARNNPPPSDATDGCSEPRNKLRSTRRSNRPRKQALEPAAIFPYVLQ